MESKQAIAILETYLHSNKTVPPSNDFIPSLEEALAWAIDCMYIVDDAIESGDVYEEEAE